MPKTKPETPERKADSTWNSYPLTPEEAGRIAAALVSSFEPDDAPTLLLLALLRSFTYTRDHHARENMLVGFEAGAIPMIDAAHKAVSVEVTKAYRGLTREGGER